ncbi:MAG: hypothetical protein PUD90_01380 [Clostridia bacterium]|nr:hypothetical protein [Clostridia bacterium]
MRLMKRVNCIKLLIIIILFLIITIFTWYYRVIHVEYIGYAIENQNINVPGYYATLTVKTTKENLEKAIAEGAYSETDSIENALGQLPQNKRMVVSWGKRIRYFYYYGSETNPTVHVKFKDGRIDNKIYFYTINYDGTIIDYVNY